MNTGSPNEAKRFEGMAVHVFWYETVLFSIWNHPQEAMEDLYEPKVLANSAPDKVKYMVHINCPYKTT